MNRREFLKGGVVAGFTALLGALGMVRVEEPKPETLHVTFTEDEIVWEHSSAFVKLEPEPDTLLGYPLKVSEEYAEVEIELGPLPGCVNWDTAPKGYQGTINFEWTD